MSIYTDVDQNRRFAAALSKATFSVYLFFIFFGTKMPFRDFIWDIEGKSTSNINNQIIFSACFLLAMYCLFASRDRFVRLIRTEKFMTLFFVWCIATLLWSDFPFVSFKRLLQVITAYTVSCALMIHLNSADEALKYFRGLLYIYVPLSFLAILTIPGAKEPRFTAWRGFAPSKNHFGQACLVSILIWYISIRVRTEGRKWLFWLMLLLSIVMLIGSKSMTAILVGAFLAGIGTLLLIERSFGDLGVGRVFSLTAIFSVVVIAASVFVLAPDIITWLPTLVGKDATFTGRTDLWLEIVEEIARHPLQGAGIGGFWVVNNPAVLDIYDEFIWLPNQSHNGYIDLINETGLIGFGLFILMVTSYFIRAGRLPVAHHWKWLVITGIILNFQESTLFRLNFLTGILFTFCYIALQQEWLKRKESLEQFSAKIEPVHSPVRAVVPYRGRGLGQDHRISP